MSLICIKRINRLRFIRISNICMVYGREILVFGSQLFGGSIVAMLLVPFNKLIISRYIGVASVPIFEITFNGSMQIRGVVDSGLRAIVPEISRVSADITEKSLEKIKELNRKCIKFIAMAGSALYGLIIVFLPWLLQLWLGDRNSTEICNVFRITLLCSYLALFSMPAYHTLLGLGKVNFILRGNVIQSMFNFFFILVMLLIGSLDNIAIICFIAAFAKVAGALYIYLQYRKTTCCIMKM